MTETTRRINWWGLGIGTLIASVSVILLVLALFPIKVFPESLQAPVESVKQSISQTQHEFGKRINPQEVPRIIVGHKGGEAELDLCDGTFTEYEPYAHYEVPPAFIAHNGCGGAVVLDLVMGQTVEIEHLDGAIKKYKVVEERRVPRFVGTTNDLLNFKGDVLVQTCFWNSTEMRFLGLEEIKPIQNKIRKT